MHPGIEDVALDRAFVLHGRADLIDLAHVAGDGIQMAVTPAGEAGYLGRRERHQHRVHGWRFDADHRAPVARAHYQTPCRVDGQSVNHILRVIPDAARTGVRVDAIDLAASRDGI